MFCSLFTSSTAPAPPTAAAAGAAGAAGNDYGLSFGQLEMVPEG